MKGKLLDTMRANKNRTLQIKEVISSKVKSSWRWQGEKHFKNTFIDEKALISGTL